MDVKGETEEMPHTQFYRRNRGSETKQPFQVHKASGGQVVLQTGTVKAT